jgi:nucleotide-binding universal stress UspA family protein
MVPEAETVSLRPRRHGQLTCIKRPRIAVPYNGSSDGSERLRVMNENMLRQDPGDALAWTALEDDKASRDGDPVRFFRDIAVVVMQLPGDQVAVTVAGLLARRSRARLTILQMLAMPVAETDAWALVPDPTLVARYAQIRADGEQQIRDMRHRLSAMRVEGDVRTLEALHSAPPVLAAAASRRADIIFMIRPAGLAADVAMAHTYFAGLLLESGRPIVVVPEGTTAHLPPRHVIVAWSDTAEAARAVHDALPLLEAAETVDVVVVDAPADGIEPAARSVESLLSHLQSHGVVANLITCSSRGTTISHVLLDQASRRRAQLIVAGGYGHGRLREWAIGGTTRELFHDSRVPVLFSH